MGKNNRPETKRSPGTPRNNRHRIRRRKTMIPKKDNDPFWQKVREFEKLLKTGEVIGIGKVRSYHGTFTGKMVKPTPTDKDVFNNDYNKFVKGDKVIVFNADEYMKYQRALSYFHEMRMLIRTEEKKIRRKGIKI
jgi:hypothetical protein